MGTVRTDYSGHKWMYSYTLQRWVKISCSCSETAPTCPRPETLRQGMLRECKSKRPTEEDLDLFEAKLNMLENPIGG